MDENTNPFEAPVVSPFEGLDTADIQPDAASDGSSNLTAQIGGIARLSGNARTENDTLSELLKTTDEARSLLDKQDEKTLRYEAAAKRITNRQVGLRNLKNSSSLVSPELGASIDKTLQTNVAQDIETRAKTALEEQAVDNIQSLLAAGNTTEARIAINRMEGKGSTVDRIRENAVKRMIFGQALEKAKLGEEEEGWAHYFVSGAANLLGSLTGDYARAGSGNVNGAKGYQHSFWDNFTPGSALQKEAEHLGSLSAAELKDYLPTFLDNVKNSSTTLGIYDPARNAEIVGALTEGQSSDERLITNVMGGAEIAMAVTPGLGLIPRKAISVPFNLASLGARKAAGASVARAVETTLAEGTEAALRATGIGLEEATEHTLPSIINPTKSTIDDGAAMVSLHTDVEDNLALAEQFTTEWGLNKTTAFVNDQEVADAIEATKNRILERTGTDIKDFNVITRDLPNGTSVRRVEATVGGHSTEAEAVQFLESRGLASEGRIGTIEEMIERKVGPTDEGFTKMLYHGTADEFEKFDNKFRGSVTGAIDAKGVTYFTDSPFVAADYARMAGTEKALRLNEEAREAFHEAGRVYDAVRANPEAPAELIELSQKKYDDAEEAYFDALSTEDNVGNIRPTLVNDQNLLIVEQLDGKQYSAAVYNESLKIAKEGGYDGVMFKNVDDRVYGTGGHSNVYAIFDTDKSVRSAFETHKTFQDVSQQWFAKVEMDVPETGFYTSPLQPPSQGFLSKFWKNTSQTSDQRLFEKATLAGNKRNRLQKLIDGNLLKAFRGLQKEDRMWLEQILMKGQNNNKWFTDTEFNVIFERASGKVPNEGVLGAYKQYRLNNDIEWTLRNNEVYRSKVIRGFETGKFAVQGDQIEADVIVDYAPKKVSRERIYNLTDDIHYTTDDNALTTSRLETLRNQGYIHVKTENPVILKDGTTVQEFLMHRSSVELEPLSQRQLAYQQGGHRLYAQKYFVKQAQKGVQPDTGKEFLKNPNVFITAPTVKHAKDWAETMNRALLAVKNGEDAGFLDANIFQQRKGFPKGNEFIQKIEDGFIDKDSNFEAVFDRELPSEYRTKEDISKFIDQEEVGFNGYYRTTGKMYYSSRGEHLVDHTGDLAPTIDPFEAQAKALYNVSKLAAFSDFKVSSVDRWVRTYRPYLNIRELPEDLVNSPAGVFNSATLVRDVPIPLQQQIEGQRETIKRILGFESDWDRGYRQFMRNTAEWIVGDSDSKLRRWASEATFKVQDNNPVNILRGLAFDMKLGMFNIGQFPIQASTMFSALALSPRYGLQGMSSGMFINMFFKSKGSEQVLDLVSKRGAWKLGGFTSEQEFKAYARDALKSGFFDLGDTHVMVNNYGPASTFGTLSGGIEAARNQGRMFFYEAEVWNRTVAHRIAYGEAVDKFGLEAVGSNEFTEFLAGRAENYSFNMSNESKAWWQQGVASIPTQFWAYNVRMIEALTGSNFTTAQKLRLVAMNMGLAGTGGLPIVAGVAEYVKQKHNFEPDIDTFLGTADRGIIDRLVYEIVGADVEVGEKWGTGSWSSDVVKDIFGMSEYNDKSLADMMGGATYGITKTALGSAAEIAKYWMVHESGNGPENTLLQEQWVKLARNVSTFSNGYKAVLAYNYGIYKTNKGGIAADNLPSQDAFFIALGFQPHEVDAIGTYMAYNKHRKEDIEETAKAINNYWQEAFTNPDKLEENAANVNALINLVPIDMKKDVLRKVHQTRDGSLYSSLLRRKEENEQKAAALTQEEPSANGEAN